MVDPEHQQALFPMCLSEDPRGAGESARSHVETGPSARSRKLTGQESHVRGVLCHTPSALGYSGSQGTGTKKNPFLPDYHSQPTAVGVHHLFPQLKLVQNFYFENPIA